MIEIKNLNFSYSKNGRQILNDINITINDNESVGIIGANGVGKSTLLKLLVGLEVVEQGSIKVNDILVNKTNIKEIRRIIGYVFQDSDAQLFMPTVYEDVAFAPRNYGYSKEEVHHRTMEALKSVGIENIKDMPIYHLSGGQKKLASIATVLSLNPNILIFDEPTVALDPRNRRRFIETINKMKGVKIIASHDLDMIYDTCERTILIQNGSIIKDGKTKDILCDQQLLEDHGLELPLSLSRYRKMEE